METEYLTIKDPTIICIDMQYAHAFTEGFRKPFDPIFETTMQKTTKYLCEHIPGVSFAYSYSDEINLLIPVSNSYWFSGDIQKIASVSASMATMAFNHYFWDTVYENINPNDIIETPYWNLEPFDDNDDEYGNPKYAIFNSRVFNIPHFEIINYFNKKQKHAISSSMKRDFSVEKYTYEIWTFEEESCGEWWQLNLNVPLFEENKEYIQKFTGFNSEEAERWEAFWRDL